MSSMQIKVVSVETTNRGKFDQCEVTYKNLSFDGKVEAKKVMSFVNKDVFSTLKSANNGDVFTISREKDDKGYWQWVGIAAGDSVPASSGGSSAPASSKPSATASPKSTYETPEERAKKQVYIVRQSSITAALNFMELTKQNKAAVSDVIDVAKIFEAYVFGINFDSEPTPLPDLDDDIPM